MESATSNSTEVFASVAVFQGDVVAASLRASKRVDGDAVRWRWPALASEAAAAECEAAVREAFLALDVRNGVFGAILRTHGGGGCALVTALPRPHRWPLLGDEGMQLFFQPDLWLEEVAALMLANGESPAPAMRLRLPPLAPGRTSTVDHASGYPTQTKPPPMPQTLEALRLLVYPSP